MMKIKKFNIVKTFRIFGKILYWLVLSCLITIALAVAVSAMNLPGGFKLYTVQSGSMAPSVPVGSVVVSKLADVYREGDVITFVSEEYKEVKNPKDTTTHRIVEIEEKDGKTFYITKGDANEDIDTEERPKENVLGKVLFSVPYVGYPIGFAKTRDGLLVLVIIPATIIVYSELLSIKKEAQRLIKEKKKKLTLKEKIEVEIVEEEIEAERGIKKLWRKIKGKIKKIKK